MSDFSGPDILADLNVRFSESHQEIEAWLAGIRERLEMPLYSSVDIRDAGWKVAAVDANVYPAGFNNVPVDERSFLTQNLADWLTEHDDPHWLHIWPESHTRNVGYAANLEVLQNILTSLGKKVTIGSPSVDLAATEITDSGIEVEGETPDLVILNNDLSDGPLANFGTAIAPPPSMGWYQRRKSYHFHHVQPFIDQAAEILGIDAWLLGTHWFVSEEKCLEKETCRTELAAHVEVCLEHISSKYDEHGISGEPMMFVKNEFGTYGLGILPIRSGEELLNLSNRKMNRLTYGKGGRDAIDFLLQEGVPTALSHAGGVVEPCVYGANGIASATFYRVNAKKGVVDNLNSPSSRFLSIAELDSSDEVKSRSQWHELMTNIAMMGIASEMSEQSL